MGSIKSPHLLQNASKRTRTRRVSDDWRVENFKTVSKVRNQYNSRRDREPNPGTYTHFVRQKCPKQVGHFIFSISRNGGQMVCFAVANHSSLERVMDRPEKSLGTTLKITMSLVCFRGSRDSLLWWQGSWGNEWKPRRFNIASCSTPLMLKTRFATQRSPIHHHPTDSFLIGAYLKRKIARNFDEFLLQAESMFDGSRKNL